MKCYLILINAILALTIWTVSCASPKSPEPTTPVVSHGGPVTNYISLIDNLRAAGATVETAGEITQPFFSVKGNAINVNGENVQVFVYADAAAAEVEAALVSADGSSVGTTMISWIATPHFYKVAKLIVLYVGDNTAVLNVLELVLGLQFAGKSATTTAPTPPPTSSIGTGKLVTINLTAENVAFDKSTITVPAGAEVTVILNNKDSIPHNLAVYETKAAAKVIFVGEIITGPKTISYRFIAPSAPGTYFFRCDVHPTMNGDFLVTSP